MAKLIFIVDSIEALSVSIDRHRFDGGIIASELDDGRCIVVATARHHHTRFVLAEETGVVVLPGHHDPEPIGELHKHLAHIDAKPSEPMRKIAVRLAARHGPHLHPES